MGSPSFPYSLPLLSSEGTHEEERLDAGR